MIKSTKNQLMVSENPFQGNDLKVLCVCSVGILRSPTLANWLHKTYEYNTRSCGSSEDFALIPVSEALVNWADMIVFVDQKSYNETFPNGHGDNTVVVLNIPDNFNYMEEELLEQIKFQYQQIETN